MYLKLQIMFSFKIIKLGWVFIWRKCLNSWRIPPILKFGHISSRSHLLTSTANCSVTGSNKSFRMAPCTYRLYQKAQYLIFHSCNKKKGLEVDYWCTQMMITQRTNSSSCGELQLQHMHRYHIHAIFGSFCHKRTMYVQISLCSSYSQAASQDHLQIFLWLTN